MKGAIAMETMLILATFIGIVVLFAGPPRPSAQPQVIFIQARPEPVAEEGLGCLPLVACAILLVLLVSAL
jgi:hypothetical protein